MRILSDLCDRESIFEKWVSIYLKALKNNIDMMCHEKDVSRIRSILKILNELECELVKYKKWVEEEADKQ